MNKLKEKFAKFMYGRYGSDKLNLFMVIVLLVCAVLNLFVRTGYFSVLLTSWEFLLLILIYFRMFSRNISKRYAENQKYLQMTDGIRRKWATWKRDMGVRKTHHIYKCPKCKQKIRIPKGHGKVAVRCPKCGTEFIRRS